MTDTDPTPRPDTDPADAGTPAGRGVREVLRDHALLLAEADALDAHHFGEVVTEEVRYVDGRIDYTLTHRDGSRHTCPAHLLALLDTADHRLVWAWDAPEDVVIGVTDLPGHVRELARERGPAELASSPQPFDGEWNPRRLVEAARALAGVYPLRLRGHTPDRRWQAAYVLDTPWTRLGAPTGESVRAAVLTGLDLELPGLTHRELVLGYGRTREGLTATEEGDDVLLRTGAGDEIRVRCDDAGEVLHVSGGPGGLTLDDMVDDAYLLSAEHQVRLEDVAGRSATLSYDLDACTLTIEPHEEGRTGPLVCEAVQLGTRSEETRDWLWAWAQPDGAAGRRRSAELRELGLAQGIGPLVRRRVSRGERTDGWVFEIAAKPALGMWTAVSVRGNTEGTVRGFFLVDHPELRLGPASSWEFGRAATFAASGGRPPARDARRALESYARLRGVRLRWTDARRERCELDFGGGDVAEVELDERGRIGRVRGSSGGAAG